jgi:asparagine synthase (glutamine-hydrolysing)
MPGIVGIVSQRPARVCEAIVRSMVSSMQHESFYVCGTYLADEMGVYAGWVAHENSFAVSQVFFNEQKDIALIFAGDCFADAETRAGLHQKGHILGKNRGDWLVHLYEEKGEQFFGELNGLFSGLLIDKRQHKGFLFNDRYGLERIYWHQAKDAAYFASEAKALLCVLPELRTFDEEGVAQFLDYGCTVEGRTLFRGIQLLPGASLWAFEDGKSHQRRTYFSPAIWESQPLLSADTFEARFQETFMRILPRYFESESDIGISLTGGLDTRMIMACLPDTGQKPRCYTFSGETGETFDDRLAARVAKTCGLEHRLLRIKSDFFSNFGAHVDRTVYVTDGYWGVTGAHEIYFNRQARQLAPVRLTGNYGSQVLRGMSTFKPIGLSPDLLNMEFGSSTQSVANANQHRVTFAAFREIPWNLFGSFAAGRSQVTLRTPYLDNELVALSYQSPQEFQNSSLFSSQLVRANSVILSEIPTDRGFAGENSGLGFWLRRFAAEATFKIDYYNSEGLPCGLSSLDSVFRRLSSGLGLLGLHKYLPYRHWFRRELAEYVNDKLADAHTRQMPFWNSDFLSGMTKDHLDGRKNYVCEINAVLTLEAVERLLLREHAYRQVRPNHVSNRTVSEVFQGSATSRT